MAKGYKTGGRQAGTPNKATTEFRQTITSLLEKNAVAMTFGYEQPPKRKRTRPTCGHVDNARALTTCPQAQNFVMYLLVENLREIL